MSMRKPRSEVMLSEEPVSERMSSEPMKLKGTQTMTMEREAGGFKLHSHDHEDQKDRAQDRAVELGKFIVHGLLEAVCAEGDAFRQGGSVNHLADLLFGGGHVVRRYFDGQRDGVVAVFFGDALRLST